MINPQKLPSESDRLAVAGCLAASLGISIASRCQGLVASSVSSSTNSLSSDFDDDERLMRRTRSFYQRLLDASVEFLFLGPEDARACSPYLDIARSMSSLHLGGGDGVDHRGRMEGGKEKIEEEEVLRRRRMKEEKTLFRPLLESLSGPEESFKCIALLVFRLLLSSGAGGGGTAGDPKSTLHFEGYDARAR